jgi:hypothetical protein
MRVPRGGYPTIPANRDWYSTPEWRELWQLDLCAVCGEHCSLMGIATYNGNSEIPTAIYFLHHPREGGPCKYKIRSARTLRTEIRELVDALKVMRALGAPGCACGEGSWHRFWCPERRGNGGAGRLTFNKA